MDSSPGHLNNKQMGASWSAVKGQLNKRVQSKVQPQRASLGNTEKNNAYMLMDVEQS